MKYPKRGPDGRFVKYICEDCEDEGSVGCSTCMGSGIGTHGPIETSRCSRCHGHGEVPCHCQE